MSTKSLFPLSFSITTQGILYLLAVLLLSFAILHTSNNLLYIILAAMMAAFVVSSIVSRNSLKQVSILLQVPENVFEREKVPVKISVVNTKHVIPSFSVRIENIRTGALSSPSAFLRKLLKRKPAATKRAAAETGEGFMLSAYFPVLRPGETHSRMTIQSFPHRGLFRMEDFRLSTRFPFGLFRHIQNIGVNGEVLVYPSIKDISNYFHRLPFLPGFLEGIHKGEGENLFSIRPYREGENARIIDWKATAKMREMMGREFTREEECRCCLILDTRTPKRPPGPRWEEFETAVSFAASIAAHFIENGAGMELLTPFHHIPYATGRDHLYRILRFLATVEYACRETEPGEPTLLNSGSPGSLGDHGLKQIFSDKVFRITLASRASGIHPEAAGKSSHTIFFDEL